MVLTLWSLMFFPQGTDLRMLSLPPPLPPFASKPIATPSVGPSALAAGQSGSSATFHLHCYWPGLATTVSCLEFLTYPNWSFCFLSYYPTTYSSCDSQRHFFKILRHQTLNPTMPSYAFRLKWPRSQLIQPSPPLQPYALHSPLESQYSSHSDFLIPNVPLHMLFFLPGKSST